MSRHSDYINAECDPNDPDGEAGPSIDFDQQARDEQALKEFRQRLAASQIQTPQASQDVIDEHFWDLL